MTTIQRDVRPILDRISELIVPLGTGAFERQFYDVCRSVFDNDQCNVFAFDKALNAPPRRVISTASSEEMRALTREMAKEYVEHGFRDDPTLAWGRSRCLKPFTHCVRTVSGNEIADQAYRGRFYDKAKVRQKLSMIASCEKTVLYVNFYRNPGQPEFDAEQRQNLDVHGTMLCRLLSKHIEITGPKSNLPQPTAEMTPAFHQDMWDRLRDALFADPAGLTPREADICASIASGVSANGISLALRISPNTVATHRKRAYSKLHISSQNELFARYYESVTDQVRGQRLL